MGLKEGKVRPTEKGHGKICIGILFQQGLKRACCTAICLTQSAQPLTAVALEDFCPPAESASTYAKSAIYAGQAPALAEMGIKHAKDEDEAIAQVRNDRVEQNGVGMAAGGALDPPHPKSAQAYLVGDKIYHSPAVAVMLGAFPRSAAVRASLFPSMAGLAELVIEPVRILHG